MNTQGDAILIDVREADEFKAEHITYASSLPLSNLKSLFSQMNIPVTRKVIFHCFKGKRGAKHVLAHKNGALVRMKSIIWRAV